MPNMQHPNGGKPIDVAPGYVDMYASQGWVKAPKTTTDRASGKSGTASRTTTKKEKA